MSRDAEEFYRRENKNPRLETSLNWMAKLSPRRAVYLISTIFVLALTTLMTSCAITNPVAPTTDTQATNVVTNVVVPYVGFAIRLTNAPGVIWESRSATPIGTYTNWSISIFTFTKSNVTYSTKIYSNAVLEGEAWNVQATFISNVTPSNVLVGVTYWATSGGPQTVTENNRYCNLQWINDTPSTLYCNLPFPGNTYAVALNNSLYSNSGFSTAYINSNWVL